MKLLFLVTFFSALSLSLQSQAANLPVLFSPLEDIEKLSGSTFRIDSTFLPIGTELEFSGSLPKKCFEGFGIVARQGSDAIEMGITLPQDCQWSSLSEKKQKELLKQKTVKVKSVLKNMRYAYNHPPIYFLEVTQNPKTKKVVINKLPLGSTLNESNYGNWLNSPVKVYLEDPPPFEIKLPPVNPPPETGDQIPEDWNTERLFRFYPSRYGFDSKKENLELKYGGGFLTKDMLSTFIQASVPVSEQNKIGVSYDFCQLSTAEEQRGNIEASSKINAEGSFKCIQDHGFVGFVSHQLDDKWSASLEGYHGPQYNDMTGTEIGQRIYIRIVKKLGP